jgi:hypothetical protein
VVKRGCTQAARFGSQVDVVTPKGGHFHDQRVGATGQFNEPREDFGPLPTIAHDQHRPGGGPHAGAWSLRGGVRRPAPMNVPHRR